jgi:hypothetical protein
MTCLCLDVRLPELLCHLYIFLKYIEIREKIRTWIKVKMIKETKTDYKRLRYQRNNSSLNFNGIFKRNWPVYMKYSVLYEIWYFSPEYYSHCVLTKSILHYYLNLTWHLCLIVSIDSTNIYQRNSLQNPDQNGPLRPYKYHAPHWGCCRIRSSCDSLLGPRSSPQLCIWTVLSCWRTDCRNPWHKCAVGQSRRSLCSCLDWLSGFHHTHKNRDSRWGQQRSRWKDTRILLDRNRGQSYTHG